MAKKFYTLWKAKENEEEALLLQDEKFYRTRHFAFNRAHQLAKQLVAGWDFVILVRRITIGSDMCTEWEFQPE